MARFDRAVTLSIVSRQMARSSRPMTDRVFEPEWKTL
jgi:hypothetical protein